MLPHSRNASAVGLWPPGPPGRRPPWPRSIVEMPRTDGSGVSPGANATLASPVRLVVASPAGKVDTGYGSNGFTGPVVSDRPTTGGWILMVEGR